jgi:hypothetical protein
MVLVAMVLFLPNGIAGLARRQRLKPKEERL